MSLKPNTFNHVMSAFEKARYNICYVINSSQNAVRNYNKDLLLINQINMKDDKEDEIAIKAKKALRDVKIHNQFFFKKNEERQRKLRIEASIGQKKDEDDVKDFDYYNNKEKNIQPAKNEFKSIIDSELITKLLKHMKNEEKKDITTQRINNEIDGPDGEEGEEIKKKRKTIRLNF